MKAKKLSKKLISIILTIMMLATMLPATSVHTHAAVDNSGVTLEYSGTEVADSTIINNTNQKVKVYTITEDGEYVLKTSAVTEYGVTIIIGEGVSNVILVLDNVNIDAHMPVMPDMVQGVNYNNSIYAGLSIYNSGNELTDLEVNINGSNIIGVATDRNYDTSSMLVRGCNVNFYGNNDSDLLLNNNSAGGTAYGFINLTKDGYVGEAVPFEEAPYLVMNRDTNISVNVQQGYGIIAVREIDMFSEARISVHSKYTAIQSYVDENVLENGYFGLYVDNSIISVDSMGAGICINNGGAYFCGGSDVSINSSDTALEVNSGNITFEDINNAYINSTNGYGLALNDSSLYVEFFSNNVSICGVQGAIKGMPDYLSSRGYVGDTEIITLHSDDGVDYSEFTDDATTKKYVKTSAIAHTHDFGEDYYESDVAGNHYMLCACGEMSELEECTYSFSHFEAVPSIDNDGIKVYYCDYCNARNVVTIPAHDCNAYTNFQIDENGNHYGDCTYEGCERYIDEPHNLELLEELDENSHKHICAACGYYEAEDHLFVEFEFIDEDTHEAYCECGYTGVKPHEYFEFSGNNDGETHTGYCYCGAEITGYHNWSDWSETGNGHMRTCDVCGAEEHGAHQWDDWYGISMLQHQHECQVCHKLENVDHVWDNDWVNRGENGHSQDCLDCGWRITEDHEFDECGDNGDGTHTFYCFCGAEVIEDHNWGDWTETDNGYIHSCDDCGATESCTHEWSGWSCDDVMHSRHCTICPAVEEDEHHSEDGYIDMGIGHYMICDLCENTISAPHEFDKCGDNGDGTHTGYCFCGAEVTGNHNWGDWEEAEDGSGTFHTCNDCYATEYCSHEWSDWYGISNLQHQHQCEICGTTKDSRHTWDDWTDKGTTHSHDCSGCGWRITEEHDYINIWDDENGTTHTAYCICGKGITSEHDWSQWIDTEDGQHRRECNECGAEEIGEHNWGEWESINEESHQRFCLDCESAREEASHNLTDNWVDIGEEGHRLGCVDCEYGTVESHEIHENIPNEDGKTHTGYCFCGAVITVPHTWGECIESEDGHTRLCTDCTYSVDEAHNWGEWEDLDGRSHYRKCLDCTAEETVAHNWDVAVDLGNEGHKQTCSTCGTEKTNYHEWGQYLYDENGETHTSTCGICGATDTQNHEWSDWEETENGHSRYCIVCNESQEGSHNLGEYSKDGVNHTAECADCHAIVSEGHTYGDYEYVDNHTHERICSVCKYVESEKHRYHSIKGCTDNGDGTHTYECTRCSEKITVEHTLTYDKYNSEKHVITCGDCKLEIYEIHNWSEWELSIDGSRNRYCLDCGEQQSCYHENKTYTESDGQKHKVTCDNCGWCYSELHEYEDFIPQGDGTHKSACRCGYWFMEDHFYICEDNGNGTHTGTCGCGDVVTESHNYDFETVILLEPTEGRPGSKREYCSCGAYKNSNFVSYYDANGDDVVDEMDYQLLINEILQDANEQSGTSEYDEIIKYDLDGDGYLDVLDASIMALVVNGHKSIWEVQNTTRGDFDLDGVAFTDNDLVGMYYALWDIEASAPTLSTSQKFAADLNCNGRLDEEDLVKLKEDYPRIGSLI